MSIISSQHYDTDVLRDSLLTSHSGFWMLSFLCCCHFWISTLLLFSSNVAFWNHMWLFTTWFNPGYVKDYKVEMFYIFVGLQVLWLLCYKVKKLTYLCSQPPSLYWCCLDHAIFNVFANLQVRSQDKKKSPFILGL